MTLRSYYKETIWLRWWIWLLFILAMAFPLSILVAQSLFELPAWWKPAPVSALLILIVTFGLILLNFRNLRIEVDSENIRVRYGIAEKTIPLNEVVSCEPTTAKLRVYGGVGTRLGTNGSLAFTTSSGNAVKIKRRNGLSFVFSTSSPEKLSKIVNEIPRVRLQRSESLSKFS